VKVAQIVAAPDPRLVEVCVAYVERIPGESATDQELIEFCRARLAGFKVPRRVRFVTEWPMTGSGKIQRRALRDQEFAQTQTAPV
jgi:acyl-CoA synthetase (AMP-forming)/AMP-acid ligase II